MIPRFGAPPEQGRSYVTRAGVYALLPLNGMLLLTWQLQPHPDLQLPGGGIDPGESPVSALHREVFEETGWKIAAPRKLGTYRRFTFMPEYDLWAEKICHIYRAAPVRKLGPPTEPFHQAVWRDPVIAANTLGSAGDRHFARRFA